MQGACLIALLRLCLGHDYTGRLERAKSFFKTPLGQAPVETAGLDRMLAMPIFDDEAVPVRLDLQAMQSQLPVGGLFQAGQNTITVPRGIPLEGLLAGMGLDIKAPRAAYARIPGLPGSAEQAFASLARPVSSGLSFETRTTWHPALLDETDLIALAQELAEARAGHWVFQAFRPDGCADPDLVAGGPAHLPPLLLARLRAVAPALVIAVRD